MESRPQGAVSRSYRERVALYVRSDSRHISQLGVIENRLNSVNPSSVLSEKTGPRNFN